MDLSVGVGPCDSFRQHFVGAFILHIFDQLCEEDSSGVDLFFRKVNRLLGYLKLTLHNFGLLSDCQTTPFEATLAAAARATKYKQCVVANEDALQKRYSTDRNQRATFLRAPINCRSSDTIQDDNK